MLSPLQPLPFKNEQNDSARRIAYQPEIRPMRDVMEMLRAKEEELLTVKRQVEALRIALPLLGTDTDGDPLVPPTTANRVRTSN